jgi:serine phosphatase RsbU (regulator of sigma subunit)
MFSDGITDQFGDDSNQKYSVRRLQNKVEQFHQEPMTSQLTQIQDDVSEWRGTEPQTDDMVLIGIRFLH